MASSQGDDDEPGSSTGTSHHMRILYRENERLRKDLEDCRDQLFQIMQKGNDIPEGDIKNAFNMIYSGIDSWIDEVSCEETLEESFKKEFKRKAQNKSSFAALGLHPQCYSDINWLVGQLGKLRYCLHIVVSLAISKFLMDEIFRNEQTDHWGNLYPHGLSDEQIEFLVETQVKMKDKLQRDASDISKWRGQTISALLTFEKAKMQAKEAYMRHLSTLKRNLEDWLGKQLSEPLSDSLMDSVILRATEALDMICCSNRTYLIGSPPIPPGPMDEQAELFHIKDMISWRRTPSSKTVDLLQCLYPGVMRIGESGQDNLLLVQPTWLGYEEPGHLPRALPTQSTVAPSDKKDSKRRGNEETKTTKAQPTRRSLLSNLMTWPRREHSAWARGVTNTGKVIPKNVATLESTSRRGSSVQQTPGVQYVSRGQLNTADYTQHITGFQLPASEPPHENRPSTNDGYDQNYGRDSRRSKTTMS